MLAGWRSAPSPPIGVECRITGPWEQSHMISHTWRCHLLGRATSVKSFYLPGSFSQPGRMDGLTCVDGPEVGQRRTAFLHAALSSLSVELGLVHRDPGDEFEAWGCSPSFCRILWPGTSQGQSRPKDRGHQSHLLIKGVENSYCKEAEIQTRK